MYVYIHPHIHRRRQLADLLAASAFMYIVCRFVLSYVYIYTHIRHHFCNVGRSIYSPSATHVYAMCKGTLRCKASGALRGNRRSQNPGTSQSPPVFSGTRGTSQSLRSILLNLRNQVDRGPLELRILIRSLGNPLIPPLTFASPPFPAAGRAKH